MLKREKGFSLVSLILFLAVIGVVGIYGFQIGMGYLDQQTIRGAVKTALVDARSNEGVNAREIKANILKRISVNTIDINSEDISVSKEDGNYKVNVDYSKEIKVTDHIKIVMNLNVEEVGGK